MTLNKEEKYGIPEGERGSSNTWEADFLHKPNRGGETRKPKRKDRPKFLKGKHFPFFPRAQFLKGIREKGDSATGGRAHAEKGGEKKGLHTSTKEVGLLSSCRKEL